MKHIPNLQLVEQGVKLLRLTAPHPPEDSPPIAQKFG
jgi:hypothetical protein